MPSLHSWQRLIYPILAPLGWLYAAVMRIRAARYASCRYPRHRPAVPTVSVGNIGMGGSGKTPLSDWILSRALRRGMVPALLSRGYRATPPNPPLPVTGDTPWRHCGDEPLMLARANPGALVVADPVRSRAAKWVEETHRPDLMVLDDGFQHMAVDRDLDLVLLTPRDLGRGWGRVFPAGYWREGTSALARAHCFLVKAPDAGRADALLERALARTGHLTAPVFTFFLRPGGATGVTHGHETPLPSSGYLLVTGVGDPGSVEHTATQLTGRGPLEHLAYPDHHPFSRADWERILATMRTLGAAFALCTPKDAVKLAPFADDSLLMIRPDVVFGPFGRCDTPFEHWLFEHLSTLRADHPPRTSQR